MRKLFALLFAVVTCNVFAQQTPQQDTLSLIFIGDIMGHSTQIKSAYDAKTATYNYADVFKKVAPIIKDADFSIANLEVTLAGKPYTGYPAFSSPDELATVCKNIGLDVLVTANNHTCDRGKKGVLRTLKVLDSLQIKHTGTFKDSVDRAENNLLTLQKNNIKVGVLNYTYGTNGIKTPAPTIVNRIDTAKMIKDIADSKTAQLDKLIVVIHWGLEYHSQPSKAQIDLAKFLFKKGVDIIIGSHPHVLQKMEYQPATETVKEQLVVYSLGNFVSNQRTRKRDGGAMFRLILTKNRDKVNIAKAGYYLTWVHKTKVNGKSKFEILPCSKIEADSFVGIDAYSKTKMKLFLKDSRALLKKENVGVEEIE